MEFSCGPRPPGGSIAAKAFAMNGPDGRRVGNSRPFLPASPVRVRRHKWGMRQIVNAIFYVLRGGVAWSLLPREFPPRSTVFHWFSVFHDTCRFETINHALVIADRERLGRAPAPHRRASPTLPPAPKSISSVASSLPSRRGGAAHGRDDWGRDCEQAPQRDRIRIRCNMLNCR